MEPVTAYMVGDNGNRGGILARSSKKRQNLH